MYKIAICEDEKIQLNNIHRALISLDKRSKVSLEIDLFESGEDFIAYGQYKYDIILLDIQMKGLTGIEIARKIREKDKSVKIIFITSLEQYWPEGYTVNAYRYIIKPIQKREFFKIILSLIEEIAKEKDFILLKKDDRVEKVKISEIKYLGIEQRKISIYTLNGVYKSYDSLSQWNKKLIVHGFANPHTSYLVNLKYVKSMDKDKILLTTGDSVHVSQRKYRQFKEQFIEYVGSMI